METNDERLPMGQVGGRAKQVLDLVYRLGRASAADIQSAIPDIPSYSAVRSILRALEGKGLIEHEDDGVRYMYRPTTPKRSASRSALAHVMDTFFEGSPSHAVKAILDLSRDGGQEIDFEELEHLIRVARKEEEG